LTQTKEDKRQSSTTLEQQIKLLEQTAYLHVPPTESPAKPLKDNPPRDPLLSTYKMNAGLGGVVSGELNLEPRISGAPAPNAGTTSVNPSAPHAMTDEPMAQTSVGRGNPSVRSSGSHMPPQQLGTTLPMPGQLSGWNMPGSTIKQAPNVLQQVEQEPKSPGRGYPPLVVPTGGAKSFDETPGRGNVNPPLGRIGARTSAGNDANPIFPGDSGISKQVVNPIHQERAFIDQSRPDAFASQLIQKLPASHILGGTTLQEPTTFEQPVVKAPSDSSKADVLQTSKPEATDSAGVQKLSDDFTNAGLPTRVRRVTNIVEARRD